MKLSNATPYPAYLMRTVIEGQRMFASLGVRITYDIVDGALRPAGDQAWKVQPGPWDSEYGKIPHDDISYREGVDVIVFGSARAPRGRPTTRVDVEVRLGRWRGQVAVFGDRVWKDGPRGPVPGEPRPFTAVPLTLAHAFGGHDEWDELAVPFTDNPEGKGYYLEEARAIGRPLPNIEDPARLIQRWDDRPEPVGTAMVQQGFGPQLRRSVVLGEDGSIADIKQSFYNNAFPQMIAPTARPGDRVVVSGVAEAGPLAFELPACGVTLRVGVGADHRTFTPAIDQVGVEPDRMRAFVSYRQPFRYDLVPLEKRYCELVLEAH